MPPMNPDRVCRILEQGSWRQPSRSEPVVRGGFATRVPPTPQQPQSSVVGTITPDAYAASTMGMSLSQPALPWDAQNMYEQVKEESASKQRQIDATLRQLKALREEKRLIEVRAESYKVQANVVAQMISNKAELEHNNMRLSGQHAPGSASTPPDPEDQKQQSTCTATTWSGAPAGTSPGSESSGRLTAMSYRTRSPIRYRFVSDRPSRGC